MIHLLVANKFNTSGSALFYLGNIAPDAVVDWHDKDVSHFRDMEDRQPALLSLAKETTGDFAEGVLLHLYCDWKWDTGIRQKYIGETGDDWFVLYRNELSLAGSYAFHHTEWAKRLWKRNRNPKKKAQSFGKKKCDEERNGNNRCKWIEKGAAPECRAAPQKTCQERCASSTIDTYCDTLYMLDFEPVG